jgi:hypothetical protein
MDAYVRFLYHVGVQSLPQAFVHIGKKAMEGDPSSCSGIAIPDTGWKFCFSAMSIQSRFY